MMGLEPTTFCMASESWVGPVVTQNRTDRTIAPRSRAIGRGEKCSTFPALLGLFGQ
jgi:hypothetical protein